MGVAKRWHRLLRAAVESPSLEHLRSCMDMVLGNQLWWPCLSRGGLDQMGS